MAMVYWFPHFLSSNLHAGYCHFFTFSSQKYIFLPFGGGAGDGDQGLCPHARTHTLGKFHQAARLAPWLVSCSLSQIIKIPQGHSCLRMFCVPSWLVDFCLGIELKSRNHLPSEFPSFSAHICVSHEYWYNSGSFEVNLFCFAFF